MLACHRRPNGSLEENSLAPDRHFGAESIRQGAVMSTGLGAFLGGGSAVTAEAGVTIITIQRKGLRWLTSQPGHRGLDWTRAAR